MGANANRTISKVLLFMGAPGSGKGTQSAWLSSRLGIPILSTGDILRFEARMNTPAGIHLRRVLASGTLVEDDFVCAIVGARLRRDVPARGLILDGFPRTVRQAQYLDSLLTDIGLPSPCVIHLQVSGGTLVERLATRRYCSKCGTVYNLVSRPSLSGRLCEIDGGALVQRDDDAEGVILRRLADHERSCAPLVEYYAAADYHPVDGNRLPEVVFDDLLEIAAPEEFLIEAIGD